MTEPTSWWDRPYEAAEGDTWRDMTNCDLFKERAVKTAMVVLAILVAIGLATAIYYCCNTTSTYLEHGWVPVEESNKLLSIIPGVLGTPIVLGLLIPAFCCINFERGRTFKSEQTEADIEEKEYNLLTQNLKYVYENYGSGQTGWGSHNSLADLTEGILTNPQKARLHQLDSDYHKSAKIIAQYKSKSESLMQGIKSNPEHRYSMAVKSLEVLEESWETLRKEIPGQKKPGSPLSTN